MQLVEVGGEAQRIRSRLRRGWEPQKDFREKACGLLGFVGCDVEGAAKCETSGLLCGVFAASPLRGWVICHAWAVVGLEGRHWFTLSEKSKSWLILGKKLRMD